MLYDPFIDEQFKPDLMWFIGVFNVYDQEETYGAELVIYNPNNETDRKILITNYCLDLEYLTYRHKTILIEYLATKLSSYDFDFQIPFDIEDSDASSWPRSEWYNLDSPRSFFQEVYNLAQTIWKNDLLQANLEDRSSW